MATQTKAYHIKYRKHLMDEFYLLPGIQSYSLESIEQEARAYALENEGTMVQVHSNTEGFELQYRYRDGILYFSVGHGWTPYGQ